MLPEEVRQSPPMVVPLSGPASPWRTALVWAIVGLWVSGAAWLVARYFFVADTEFGRVMPSWAPRVLAIHGAIAMLSLVAIGAWLPMHVAPRLRRRDGLATGVTQLSLLAALVATGFGLYYVADEATRPVWSAVHWLAGLLLPALILIHGGYGRAGSE